MVNSTREPERLTESMGRAPSSGLNQMGGPTQAGSRTTRRTGLEFSTGKNYKN